MKRAAMVGNDPQRLAEVYGRGRRKRLSKLTDLSAEVVDADALAQGSEELATLQVIFSTWGMPRLSVDHLDRLSSLEAVFYAAGSVKGWAPSLLDRGVLVVSGWAANAVPVAEFSLAQILLSCKGYFRNTREFGSPAARIESRPFRGRGVFGETVGIIGVGMVGRALCQLLRPFELEVIVCDPYLEKKEAAALGVESVSMEDVFQRSYVIDNHLPNLPSLRGVLNAALFSRMRENATFINTGRGAQVVEADLIETLRERPDLTALLDVTFPEPPAADSELYRLPNVQLSSHIAGSMNDEVVRMADFMIEEFIAWEAGKPLRYQVTRELLERMA
ncbi:MAG TPA: hydroxyacid dehydrogenase [Candidatus Latescibacteria bacterium]|nr:hydroxyacid dehydrogenase [Candidatus Latescibacterota bacterium]